MAIGTGIAILGAAALGVGASVYGASKASSAANTQAQASKEAAQIQSDSYAEAAKINAESTEKTIASEEKMYQQSREDLAPWRIAGENALDTLVPMVEQGPGEFVPENDPGYKFGYSEFVENPTLKNASASGKLRSGATQKALTRYAQDYASTKYDNHLARYYNSLVPYQNLAGMGSNATNQSVAANQAAGSTISNALMTSGTNQANMAIGSGNAIAQGYENAGKARASGYINQANAINGGVGNMTNALLAYQLMGKVA